MSYMLLKLIRFLEKWIIYILKKIVDYYGIKFDDTDNISKIEKAIKDRLNKLNYQRAL